MANFNKAFNFRGGFQVDTDVLIVRGQNVGIGSTIPSERLDVNGIIKANGLDIRSTESVTLESAVAGVLTVTDALRVGVETGSGLPFPEGTPQVEITTGIITSANPSIGVVTYYGDGGRLLNLPTSQWLDIDVGLGFTSIYAQGYVGVDTTDPRYVFQVGGVPYAPKAGFNTSQIGVGIEDGEIYASGIITTQSTIGAAGTIYTADEFVGVGSNLTILNADNIAIGSIGSMRYGDIINTKEVYADRFIGIADTAVSVTPDATLVFDTARANEITAINRFITTEGGISVGHNDPPSAGLADVDVRKDSGDSRIYSTSSNSATAKIFVGHEREGGGRNAFGGLRFGGNVTGSPTSGVTDLDIVNYDVGNVNFVLHDGSIEGGTAGEFRWIYGQFDTIPMRLDKDGKLSLEGNLTPTNPALEVSGISSFLADVLVDGNLDVTGDTLVRGDLNITGDLQFGTVSIGDTITAPSITITDTLLVGTAGGANVTLTSNGEITASSSLQVANTVTINNSGILLSGGAIGAPLANIPVINTTDITTTDIDAGGFSVNSGTTTIDNLVVNSFGGGTPDFNGGNISASTLSAGNITASTGDIDFITCDTLSAAVSVSAPLLNVSGDISCDVLNASSLSLSSLLQVSTIEVQTINPSSGAPTIAIGGGIEIGSGDSSFAGNVVGFSSMTANLLFASQTVIATKVKASTSDIFLNIVPGDELAPADPNVVQFVFTKADGSTIGTADIPIVP